MSTAQDILAACADLGVLVEARGDRIHFAPKSVVPQELVARMRDSKPELLAFLNSGQPAPQATAKSDTGGLLAVLSVPAGEDPQILGDDPGAGDFDRKGRPLHGCWNCGCRDYARDLADSGWVCVQDHPIEEYRAHVARWTAPLPSRRGGV